MKLLIIEDDPRIAETLSAGLAEEKFLVEVAEDGERGEYLAAINHYDVVILDLLLPGRNGMEVCRNLRTQGINTPILMLTALDATSDKIAGLNCGADDYLTKPFVFEELLARLRALLRRGPAVRDARLHCEQVTVDTVGHVITVNGRQVELTAREYMLLECLMQNQGKVLTRQQLADQVWGAEYDPLSNVIDVYINYLRNKVDTHAEHKLIHTIRGLGYMLKSKPREDARKI
ncbi:MAG TPA: response regulator transcription factor [Blastocatellia bacterium]|nr:response regulator transcription factor [Blastocatellia bacterium]HMY74240.1 response regulator transcription factor [Blastocatellia bacterium]HMZ18347.1 response regulator transcription factor [Blastocatellia bacterium]HNG31726.1 response regulator transcription factor [Blastocatellia bacterium]